MKIIRPTQLSFLLSVSRSTLWRMEQRGELPARRQISQRLVGWLESDINEWLVTRPEVQSLQVPSL